MHEKLENVDFLVKIIIKKVGKTCKKNEIVLVH